MTVHDLQQLVYLDQLIQYNRDKLDALRASVDVKSPVLTNMPKAPGARDKLGEKVPEIVDQENELIANIKKYEAAKGQLIRFINSVPNARLKMIRLLRFEERLSWQDVADRIGGKETEYSVKKLVYRYLNEPY